MGTMEMRTRTRRYKHLFLCILLVASILEGLLDSKSNQVWKVSAASKSTAEAMVWVKSQVGNKVNGGQCVGLITAYYSYLGVSPVSGNGKDYATNTLPAGWSRVKGGSPQTGDILVYSACVGNQDGHVAIYESARSTYHQNYNNNQTVQHVTNVKYNEFANPYWGYIRPNSKPEKAKITVCKSTRKGCVRMKWKNVPESKGYQVQYARKRSFAKKRTENAYGNSSLLYGLKSKKTYYIRMRAYKYGNSANNYKRVYGKWSNVKKVRVK